MAPNFEQLLQIIRVAACEYDGVHVVLASRDDFTFLENTPRLREELQEAIRDGYQTLGLLGWETADGRVRAHKMFFRWHQEEELAKLFDQICQVGVNSVGPPLGDHQEQG
ncbi:MAG: hypothetical protein P8020_07855 [Acidobacteriota bacterium]